MGIEQVRTDLNILGENVDPLNSLNNWINITSNPKRSIHSVILDPGVKEMLLEDAREFLVSQPWYAARGWYYLCMRRYSATADTLIGIPFRRGYLLVRVYAHMNVPRSAQYLYSMVLPGLGRRLLSKASLASSGWTCTSSPFHVLDWTTTRSTNS